MKKRLTAAIAALVILVLAIASIIGCSGAQKSVEKYAEVTAQNFGQKCETPDEVHAIPPSRFPIAAQVIRHKNCMSIPDMLIIVWPGEPTEKNITAVKLLMLMYIDHQHGPYHGELLKIDKDTGVDFTVSIAFYKLVKIEENKNEDL
jgi:hypothetical protein